VWRVETDGLEQADLQARRKGEPRKVELAWELRFTDDDPAGLDSGTAHMGTRGHLAWLLHHRGQCQPAAPLTNVCSEYDNSLTDPL